MEIQLPKLLKFEDRNSMTHSIEARVPFIDNFLIEKSLTIPEKYKINKGWSKFILRKSFGKDAPKEIVWRKNKFGFEAPAEIWMNNKEYFRKTISESVFLDNVIDKKFPIEKLENNTIWKLFNIAKWAETFNVEY